MNKIAGMLQKRAALLDEAAHLTGAAIAEGRGLKPDELARVAELRTEAAAIETSARAAEALEREMARTAVPIS